MPILHRKWKRDRVSSNMTGEQPLALLTPGSMRGRSLARIANDALDGFFISKRPEDRRQALRLDHIRAEVKRLLGMGTSSQA